jgi:ABC-type phosphate transport system substrate-binding protein
MKLNTCLIMKSTFLKLGWLGVVLTVGSFRALALDGAVVIANSGVSAGSLSADALKDIYTGKTKYWDGGQAVIIAVLPDKTDAALQQACGMDTSSFKTFWQRLAFSGRGQEPKKAADAAALVALVASTKGAIAIVPADAALDGVKKIEVK